jgi:hypothetical protein
VCVRVFVFCVTAGAGWLARYEGPRAGRGGAVVRRWSGGGRAGVAGFFRTYVGLVIVNFVATPSTYLPTCLPGTALRRRKTYLCSCAPRGSPARWRRRAKWRHGKPAPHHGDEQLTPPRRRSVARLRGHRREGLRPLCDRPDGVAAKATGYCGGASPAHATAHAALLEVLPASAIFHCHLPPPLCTSGTPSAPDFPTPCLSGNAPMKPPMPCFLVASRVEGRRAGGVPRCVDDGHVMGARVIRQRRRERYREASAGGELIV